jgi:hypothetical protein
MPRSTHRSVKIAIPVSGKTSWSTKAPSQETVLVEGDELDSRRQALASALSVLNDRERRIFESRRLTEETNHAQGTRRRVRRLTRARAPDRRELVREGAETVKSRGDVMEEVRTDGSVTIGMSYGNRTT